MTYEAPLDREICLMGFICMKRENYMKVDFENSFELLSQEEWNQYLSEEKIDSIMVDKGVFAKFSDKIMMYPILMEEIDELNNKVGSIKVSYALCRHYYDKGIPDKPYYISPGKDGQSVQYFPNFKNEHWMRLYWFNHFADAAYMKLFSVWDTLDEAVKIHRATIEKSGGGDIGDLDLGKLDSVLTHIQNDDYYPTFIDKLVHLFFCSGKYDWQLLQDGN